MWPLDALAFNTYIKGNVYQVMPGAENLQARLVSFLSVYLDFQLAAPDVLQVALPGKETSH